MTLSITHQNIGVGVAPRAALRPENVCSSGLSLVHALPLRNLERFFRAFKEVSFSRIILVGEKALGNTRANSRTLSQELGLASCVLWTVGPPRHNDSSSSHTQYR